MPWGAKEFSRVSGFKGHSWPAAACRGGSHLLRAALKAAGVTPPPRAGPTPPGARAPGSEGGCARVRSSRRDAAPRCGEEAAVSGSVSEEPEGSSGATARQGPRGGRNRCASAALPPSRRRPGLYLLRPQPRPGTEAQARPPFPAAQAELAGRTDRRTGGPTGASGRDGGPAGPHPEGAGTGSAGGARATREGATAQAGLWGRESAAGDRAATLARRPGDARALALVRVAARLLVPPSRRPSLLLLPRPPRCQGNPRDAGPGGEVLGGAAAAPGARPVAAWEQLTMEPQSKAAAAGAGAGAGAGGPPRTGVGAPRAAPRASDAFDMEIRSPPCTFVSWSEGG